MAGPANQSRRANLRRSKDGCLNCRRKRKKCDEKWPSCSRCTRTGSKCVWPPPTSVLQIDSSMDAAQIIRSLAPPGIETNEVNTSGFSAGLIFTDSAQHFHTGGSLSPRASSNLWDLMGAAHSKCPVWPDSGLNGPTLPFPWAGPTINGDSVGTAPRMCTLTGSRVTKTLAMRMWEYAHEFGPRITWPPEGCTNCDELDPEGVAPAFHRSMMVLTRGTSVESGFQDVCYFYSTFLTRLFYDYSLMPETIGKWITRRFNASKTSKYGMLSLAALYRSDYQNSISAASLRANAKEMYSLATLQLPHDLEDTKLSPWEKLTGLLGIMDFEYHTGQLSKYYSHGAQALPLIKAIIGSDTIDLFKLQGEHMFDVSIWVCCDILESMATSKPTRLKYESDLERVARPGTEESSGCQGKGLEWMDAKLPEEEKASRGIELEHLTRNWEIRLLGAKDPRLRVTRMGAQEIWRHTVILYVRYTIFKSDPSHPVVKESVKSIVKIASTLEPGSNPDSFLYISYFIAGFYAVSQRDRYIMKSRLIGCGNALYLRNLARNLDELWQETDSSGHLIRWSEKKPPRIAF
ncbi:hypothetical protein OPQ81_000165 [Rhizoctonia solani]|nr:hypothetical protein OPQ81_000165 [Rhizoctonia solani]